MTKAEKRAVIELLMLSNDSDDLVHVTARAAGCDDLVEWLAWGERWKIDNGCCLEAAYRLIESSPELRREWFGR